MTSNSTGDLPKIPPLQGISESERDKYLLIGTFLSVLIVFGIIVAFMHRKCRETLMRSKSWIITKTVRHRPTYNRTASNVSARAREVSIRHPSSPVFCKEVNAPVLFFLGSSEETTSSDRTRMGKRTKSKGTDKENSEISIISTNNIPLCTLPFPKDKYSVKKDMNDNDTIDYNFQNGPLTSDDKLIRILPPEIPETVPEAVNSQRPKLRRSSTVVDKMNFLNGYIPSSRDDDYTVITLTDESGSDCNSRHSQYMKHGNVRNDDRAIFICGTPAGTRNLRELQGIDNPSFNIEDRLLRSSQSDNEPCVAEEVTKVKMYRSSGQVQKSIVESDVRKNPYRLSCDVQVHSSQNGNEKQNLYEKRIKYKTYKLPVRSNEPNKIIDKESQELYRRIVREKIQDIIQSDSSSVTSDRSSVRSGRRKKQTIPRNQLK